MARIFLLGDNIDTDNIAPGGFLHMPIERQVEHCLESIINGFSGMVSKGDIIIAGDNFGTGSSREQAPVLLKMIGIQAVFARSFSRLFFRNSINVGLYPGTYSGTNPFTQGDTVNIDFSENRLYNEQATLKFNPPAGILREILDIGGAVNYAKELISKMENDEQE